MTGCWYDRRRRADLLAISLRALLREADDLDGIARVIDPRHPRIDTSAVPAVLESSACDLRNAVAHLIDALRDDLILAASGFDAGDVEAGCPATPERIAYLLSIHQKTS